ncbi:hypothetical protein LR48_Vigan07g175100 [Vigna angularis]|uniref:Uncharacterized protein n=1 Tax=Phaseolus angularis TaxID=3914 RepID=A0A0L9UZP5_PHAAN|nr:hypothetical protein LR48_Vigan07g175100 [Vigna angularis]
MAEAQYVVEELRMFLEANPLEDIKKKLDKVYMVLILRALHLDFYHFKHQLLISHEVPSMETLTTRLPCVPISQTQEARELVEPSIMVVTPGKGERGTMMPRSNLHSLSNGSLTCCGTQVITLEEEDEEIGDIFNAHTVKEWITLKRIATPYMVSLPKPTWTFSVWTT